MTTILEPQRLPCFPGRHGRIISAADPNIVGKTVRINKHPYTIVGVTPEGFYGTEKFLQPEIFRSDGEPSVAGRGQLA